MAAQTGLLVLTNPCKVARVLQAVTRHVRNTLYVHLLPGQNHLGPAMPSEARVTTNANQMLSMTNMIFGLYSQASVICHHLDVRVLMAGLKDPLLSTLSTKREIEVIFLDRVYNLVEVDDFVEKCLPCKTEACEVLTVEDTEKEKVMIIRRLKGGSNLKKKKKDTFVELNDKVSAFTFSNLKRHYECNFACDYVALGGTFDQLHNGHKILLSEAVLRCTKELTVGVTDGNMNKNKKLRELIAPSSERIEAVTNFLEDVDPTIEYNVVPIYDALGPTRNDRRLQMLIVSPETLTGASKVNDTRVSTGLSGLAVHTIPLLKEHLKHSEEEEDKVSSSSQRMRILGKRLRRPEPKPHLATLPYVIGLTGGIASGKSAIAQRLADLGAGVIYCDRLGHNVYKKDKSCYHRLVKVFGEEILDADMEINRKALSEIVFANKEALTKLNTIVWPEIFKEVQRCVTMLHEAGKKIIVVEAALLLEANWDESCHEVWVVIIPPEEAIKRLQERNNLSEKDARSRLDAQPPNEERIGRADVVLSTFWSPAFTQQQVEKAWKNLLEYLQSIGIDSNGQPADMEDNEETHPVFGTT